MYTRLIPFVLASTLAGFCGQASADTSTGTGTVQVSGVTITLHDLDLDDGILPSVTFSGANIAWRTSTFAPLFPPNSSVMEEEELGALHASPHIFPSGGVNYNAQGQSTSVASTSDSITITATVVRDERIAYSNDDAIRINSWFRFGNWQDPVKFELSANTLMVIDGQYTLNAAASPNSLFNHVQSSLEMAILGGDDAHGNHRSTMMDSVYSNTVNNFLDTTRHASFSLAFANTNAQTVVGSAYGFAGVATYISPIPEPKILALTLSGLTLVGVVASRRRAALAAPSRLM